MSKSTHRLPAVKSLAAVLVLAGLAACQSQATKTPTSLPGSVEPTQVLQPSPAVQAGEPVGPAPSQAKALSNFKGQFFTASGACSACHTGLKDGRGQDVSIDTDWRATMMASAARDPYWQAGVEREILANPQYRDAIEDKCSTCHAPMARFTTHTEGEKAAMLGEAGYANPEHDLHQLAMDGVSCSLCHQITDSQLGQPAGFSGGYQVDIERPSGERIIYGSQHIAQPLANVMQAATGFTPVLGKHIREAALCANCHTLHTQTILDSGDLGGDFPEQMPFVEWLHSDYAQTQSCQDCHMPLAYGRVKSSSLSQAARPNFFRHNTVAGNTYLLRIFEAFGSELGATASSAQYRTSVEQALHQLRSETARVSLENARLEQGALYVDVQITNLAGHKLPSAYPSRRAWLHLTVTDASGKVVFESGAANPDGSIIGNDNDVDASQYEPHYMRIEQPDQVQIYEAIMGDPKGEVTTTLLKASAYLKDNRILPAGFDKNSAPADVAVLGEAKTDPGFTGGRATTVYAIPIQNAQGPFTVQVELLYQSVSYRWIENLRGLGGAEIERFLLLSDQVPNTPSLAGAAQVEVKP